MAKKIFKANKAKGFWPEDVNERNTGECLMLMTSELAEALEADRKGRHVSEGHPQEAVELLHNVMEHGNVLKFKEFFLENIKDTFEDELADTMIRILDYCGAMDIDIESHIEAKLAYNATRGHKHGKAY